MEITIKEARTRCGLTQEQISRLLGCSVAQYRSIEQDPGKATIEQAKAIAIIVGVLIDNLSFIKKTK